MQLINKTHSLSYNVLSTRTSKQSIHTVLALVEAIALRFGVWEKIR